jgi:hypothetical protein
MLYYTPTAETQPPMGVGPFRIPNSAFRIQELPMPRPTVLDDVRRAEVLALASHGFSRRAIADYVDCAPNTIANTAERDPAFGQQLRLARSKFACRNIEIIQRHAVQSPKNATWLLERLDPEKFARRSPYSITPAQLHRHFQTWTKAMIAAVPLEARTAVAQAASQLAATHLPLILHADAPDAPADDDTNLPGTDLPGTENTQPPGAENTQPPGADDVTFANDSADGAPAVPPVPPSPTTNIAVPPVPSGPTTNIAVPPTTSPPSPLPTPRSALPASVTPNSALPTSSGPTVSTLHATVMKHLSKRLLVVLVGVFVSALASHALSADATVVIERDPPHVSTSAVKNPCQPVAPRTVASDALPRTALPPAALPPAMLAASSPGSPNTPATEHRFHRTLQRTDSATMRFDVPGRQSPHAAVLSPCCTRPGHH